MARMELKHEAKEIRKERVRKRLTVSPDRPRLCVFRSGRHIYAQLIDDLNGKTLASVSTLSKNLKGTFKRTSDKEAAKKVGEAIAKAALDKKIRNVCFDRGGYLYHGRVKALADGARSAGLKF